MMFSFPPDYSSPVRTKEVRHVQEETYSLAVLQPSQVKPPKGSERGECVCGNKKKYCAISDPRNLPSFGGKQIKYQMRYGREWGSNAKAFDAKLSVFMAGVKPPIIICKSD